MWPESSTAFWRIGFSVARSDWLDRILKLQQSTELFSGSSWLAVKRSVASDASACLIRHSAQAFPSFASPVLPHLSHLKINPFSPLERRPRLWWSHKPRSKSTCLKPLGWPSNFTSGWLIGKFRYWGWPPRWVGMLKLSTWMILSQRCGREPPGSRFIMENCNTLKAKDPWSNGQSKINRACQFGCKCMNIGKDQVLTWIINWSQLYHTSHCAPG